MNNLEQASKKIIVTLLIGQSFFSAATIIAFTIASIIAVKLTGNDQWTGIPSTLVVVGAAMMAYPIGWLMDRVGRRRGLSVGYVLGIAGTLLAGYAVILQALPLFLLGVFGLGLSKGVLDQGRYAAAEASLPKQRARAISWVVLGGTAGSIFGPTLLNRSNHIAMAFGFPEFTGPWFMAALLLAVMLLLINMLLRPDPQEIGKKLAELMPTPSTGSATSKYQRPYLQIFQDPRIKLAAASLIFGQLAMVIVMTMTPVHMYHYNHHLSEVAWVIQAHTLGMFGLSYFTGWLADRLGRVRVILIGGLILAIACIIAPVSVEVPWLIVSLFLLGLGWNFCFVSGSALLSDALEAHEQGRVQGLIDTLINIVSGVGSTGGGLIFAATGYTTIAWLGIVAGLIPVVMAILLKAANQPARFPDTTAG